MLVSKSFKLITKARSCKKNVKKQINIEIIVCSFNITQVFEKSRNNKI